MASTKRIQKAQQVLTDAMKKHVPVCDAVRYVADHFKSLDRAAVLEAAEGAGINKHTASTQFYKTRAGLVQAPRSLKH